MFDQDEDHPKRKVKGIWIPIEIWECEELSLQQKVFLAEIDSLDNGLGCYASNKWFSKQFGFSQDRASRIIASLIELELVSSKLVYKPDSKQVEKRLLKISPPPGKNTDTPLPVKIPIGPGKNTYTPPGKNTKDIIYKKDNIEYKRNIGNVPAEQSPSSLEEPIDKNEPSKETGSILIAKANRIIKHLNKVTSKNFRLLPTNRAPIIARLKQKATYKDCIDVINKKSKHEWFVENGHMTIDTLFRPKNFEKYLNEDPKQYKKQNKGPSNGSGVSGLKYKEGITAKCEWVDLGED